MERFKEEKRQRLAQEMESQPFFTPLVHRVPRVKWEHMSTLSFHEYGVLVVPSKWGWSLRALREFGPGSLITQYTGFLIGERDLERIPEENRQHLLSLRGGQWINGVKTPYLGCGAGSFANSSVDRANAYIWHSGCGHGSFLRTKRGCTIAPQQYVLIDYKSSLNGEFF